MVLCLLAACGKASQTTKPDVGVTDTSGTKADALVGGTLDTGGGEPDVGPGASDVDVASALPDASGADAAEPMAPWIARNRRFTRTGVRLSCRGGPLA